MAKLSFALDLCSHSVDVLWSDPGKEEYTKLSFLSSSAALTLY